MMIVSTIAEQTRFSKRNHGFSLKAANAPVSPLPAAPCSTKRRRRIPEAPFLRVARLDELRGCSYDGSIRDYSGLLPAYASEGRALSHVSRICSWLLVGRDRARGPAFACICVAWLL